jgi:hypothetical protein
MRPIKGSLTKELEKYFDPDKVTAGEPFLINTYRELVEHVAKLSVVNKDFLLFYRGQSYDFLNKTGCSTFYPRIYRSEYLNQKELKNRFDLLERACQALVYIFELKKIDGVKELKRKKTIQWGILQHYEVCDTPLLDFTHSIQVACSFALMNKNDKFGYVFVFGLPYITNRISINSEHDIINVRLLSICPPQALRPYFQEGYLAGTSDITNEYDDKDELDFNNRLIAKFKIPNTRKFWGKFPNIPKNALYPKNDKVERICNEIKRKAARRFQSGLRGEFSKVWYQLSNLLLNSTDVGRKIYSNGEALRYYVDKKIIDQNTADKIEQMLKFRNKLLYAIEAAEIENEIVIKNTKELKELTKAFENKILLTKLKSR